MKTKNRPRTTDTRSDRYLHGCETVEMCDSPESSGKKIIWFVVSVEGLKCRFHVKNRDSDRCPAAPGLERR